MQQIANLINEADCVFAQFGIQIDGSAFLGADMVDLAGGDLMSEHRLQAQALSAKLHVVMESAMPLPEFVLHGHDGLGGAKGVQMKLNDIGDTLEAKNIAIKWQRPLDTAHPQMLGGGFVGSFVGSPASQGVDVLIESLLQVDQGALSWAIARVLKGGDHDIWLHQVTQQAANFTAPKSRF